MYAEAEQQGIPSRVLSERATAWFLEDTDDLALGRPDAEPKATETIPEIVEFIEELVAREQAYVANGDVYFSVAGFPEYGRLSGARLEDMVAQETSELKRDQRDFALWKSQKEHEDAAWDSPWGPGRPGWHIECSAMAEKFLGHAFEIHGGGRPPLPAPRERARAVEEPRPRVRARLDAQRHARAERGEDVEVARQRRRCATCSTSGAASPFPLHLSARGASPSTSTTR